MASIFTQIIQEKIPCEKIFETNSEISFLDILPSAKGHCLVIPKLEVIRLEDLPQAQAISLMCTLQKVARAVSKAFCEIDYNIVLNNGPNAGQVVEHLHFHIIPRSAGSSKPFFEKIKYSDNEMQKIGSKIRNCF
tara:strand:+ start:908 stop:1312 length:405 start_codon:yes stop_codon:yes gene_type:complete